MKKAVFSLLMALLLMPCLAWAQKPAKAGAVVTSDTTACDSLVWAVTGETFVRDTTAYLSRNDTFFLLQLTVKYRQSTDVDTTVFCTFNWRNQVIAETKAFRDTLSDMYGCDSIVNINLTVNTQQADTLVVKGCRPYTFGGTTYSETGLYSYDESVRGGNNCVKNHKLDLTVANIQYERKDTVERCGSYRWRLRRRVAVGETGVDSTIDLTLKADTVITLQTLKDTAARATNCDSLITLVFNIVPKNDSLETRACGRYTMGQHTYTTSGTYIDTAYSTDSLCITYTKLTLTIDTVKLVERDTFIIACNKTNPTFDKTNRTWTSYFDSVSNRSRPLNNAQQLRQDGPVIFTHTSSAEISYRDTVAKCVDSTIHLHVKIIPDKVTIKDTSVCGTWTWVQPNANLVTVSNGTYQMKRDLVVKRDTAWNADSTSWDTIYATMDSVKIRYTNTSNNESRLDSSRRAWLGYVVEGFDSVARAQTGLQGCDSMIWMRVTVKKNPMPNAIIGKFKVNTQDTAILYAAETDTTMRLHYNWKYTDNNGEQSVTADTLVVLAKDLSGNTDVTVTATSVRTGCSVSSWITILYGLGINDVEEVALSIYPNPAAQKLHVSSDNTLRAVVVYSMTGAEVMRKAAAGTECTLDLTALPKGTYTLRTEMENGQMAVRKFVKTK